MKQLLLITFFVYLFFPVFSFLGENSINDPQLIFFSVGQGDAALFISPQGKTLLIDGGPDRLLLEKLDLVLPWYIKQIDWAILSHEHADHSSGLISLIDYYHVKNIIAPYWSTAIDVKYWLAELKNNSSQLVNLDHQIRWFELEPNCRFGVLASPLLDNFISPLVSPNNASFSVKIDCGDLQSLFTGDVEQVAEKSLLSQAPLDFLRADIFKAAHHGSNTSNSLEFLLAVNPKIIIISVGQGNRYNHPGHNIFNNAEKLLVTLWRTDIAGDLHFFAKNKQIFMIN